MKPLRLLDAVAVPLPGANIDTDQIVPARYLQKPRACDFGEFLFHDVRRTSDGSPRSDFPLNDPAHAGAAILVAGRNFGCGSSREHAVWALMDGGFRAVIAPGFGDIFHTNALKNGLLPVRLDEAVVDALRDQLQRAPDSHVKIDLVTQVVTLPDGTSRELEVEAFARHCLLEGLDELDYSLSQMDRILEFERAHPAG